MYRSSTSVRHKIYILISMAVISLVPGAPLVGWYGATRRCHQASLTASPGTNTHSKQSAGRRDRLTPKHDIGVKRLRCREPTWLFNLPRAG